MKNCKIPDANADGILDLPTKTQFVELRWQGEKKTKAKGAQAVRKSSVVSATIDTTSNAQELLQDPSHRDRWLREESDQLDCQVERGVGPDSVEVFPCLSGEIPPQNSDFLEDNQNPQDGCFLDQTLDLEDTEDIEEINRSDHDMTITTDNYSIMPWIAPLNVEARMLFSYFSETVAPVMVVLDSVSNGYRQLILPMAYEDEILRRAVSVVAAQHLSRERPEMKHIAEAGRSAVISRLRRDSFTASPDKIFSKATWATLIVLLVGTTVTGSADFAFLVQMLLCVAANNQAAFEDPDHEHFLQTQTNMYATYSG